MAKRRLYLVACDVSCPQRLQAALKVLKGYASGGQKSVFECFLTLGERSELLGAVEGVIDPIEDRFMLLPLTPRRPVATLGIALPPEDPDYYYMG